MGLNLKQAKRKYVEARKAYYAGTPIMSDETFDRLELWITERDPEWTELKKTGSPVIGKKREVKLPKFLPSLDKRYPEAIGNWFDKHIKPKWAYMAKLDGNSLLLEYVNGEPKRVITRGDGVFGKDISYFIPYISIPKKITYRDRLYLRVEAIIRKDDFDHKYSTRFDNSRNMVAGLLNRKTADDALADIHFVVLGVYGQPLLDGLKRAFSLGFETVYCKVDKPRAQAKHFDLIKQGKYEADGVVICDLDWTYDYHDAERPKENIIAYKENVEYADSDVVDVVYQISSAGRIIPKIKLSPVTLAGATIEYCTSHNAKWMIDRQIGVGARVRITRSGDVIPKIIDVLKPGTVVYPECEYKQEGVHFVALTRSKEQVVRILTKFASTLDIETVKDKTFDKLYDLGVTSVHKLLKLASAPDLAPRLQSVFGTRKGVQISECLKSIVNTRWPIAKLMVASCVFNTVGEKRLNQLQELDFDLLELSQWSPVDIKQSIISPGIGEATAEQIAQGLHDFSKFYKLNRKYLAKPLPYTKVTKINGCLTGMNITFTGYRSKEQEAIIVNNGGTVTGFSTKTNVLLYSPTGKRSSKVEKAGSKAMTWEEFSSTFALK